MADKEKVRAARVEGEADGDIELQCSVESCNSPSGYFALVDGTWHFIWMSPHKKNDKNAFSLEGALEFLNRRARSGGVRSIDAAELIMKED